MLNNALTSYEIACSEASYAGVDIVTKIFSFNWDYIQSCFFSLTILTTIGKYLIQLPIVRGPLEKYFLHQNFVISKIPFVGSLNLCLKIPDAMQK